MDNTKLIGCLGSLLESAAVGHSEDCNNDCQLCLDLESAENLLKEVEDDNA